MLDEKGHPEATHDITAAINRVIQAINETGLEVSEDLRDEAKEECVKHHPEHIRVMRINEQSIDPYKIA